MNVNKIDYFILARMEDLKCTKHLYVIRICEKSIFILNIFILTLNTSEKLIVTMTVCWNMENKVESSFWTYIIDAAALCI